MKYLFFLALILFYSTSVFSQTQPQTNPAPPTHIQIFGNGGSSVTTSKTNLTDQEKQISQNFENQAGANKIIKEKCVGDMQQACSGQEVGGSNSGLIKAAAQAYATMGLTGDFLQLSKGTGEAFNGKPAAKPDAAQTETPKPDAAKTETGKKEQTSDYCKYIPAATEAIATFSQKNTVNGLSAGGDTSQKEALFKAAKSHDSRAEQAQMQAYGWFGGAACYITSVATGTFASDTSLWVKFGAAAVLGSFYQGEVTANKEYADKTRAIANSLPGKGACNPITENECYCATPEYANDPTYCKAQIDKRNAANQAFTKVACTDNQMQLDPNCNCDKTNTCMDKFLQNQGAGALQIGLGTTNSPFNSIASLAHGRLEGASLNGQAYAQLAAIAKKGLNDAAGKIPVGGPLNPNQKLVADAFMSKGLPASLAQLMAKNPPPQSAIDQAMAKVQGLSAGAPQLAAISSGRNGVVDFSGGNGLGIGGRKNEKKGGAEDFMAKFNPAAKNANNNGKILEFAQKAEARAAQITKSDRPIFEIISLRYQTSGRRLLQLDSSN